MAAFSKSWRRQCPALPLASPLVSEAGALGIEIASRVEKRAGESRRRTAAEQFATILLPNSVARSGTKPDEIGLEIKGCGRNKPKSGEPE
jgi:hypothetical protein